MSKRGYYRYQELATQRELIQVERWIMKDEEARIKMIDEAKRLLAQLTTEERDKIRREIEGDRD